MEYETDKENLKEFPVDPDQMGKGVEFLVSKLAGDGLSDIKSAALMAQIGVFSRIVGDLDQSESMLINSKEIFEKLGHNEQAIFIQFRLAGTLHWKQNYGQADKLYRDGLKKISQSNNAKAETYKDYGLYHLGKLKFEQKQYKDAMTLFMEALELRLMSGDLERIEHCQHAISICRHKLESPE